MRDKCPKCGSADLVPDFEDAGYGITRRHQVCGGCGERIYLGWYKTYRDGSIETYDAGDDRTRMQDAAGYFHDGVFLTWGEEKGA